MNGNTAEKCSSDLRLKFVLFLHLKVYLVVMLYTVFVPMKFGSALVLMLLILCSSISFVRVCTTNPGVIKKKGHLDYNRELYEESGEIGDMNGCIGIMALDLVRGNENHGVSGEPHKKLYPSNEVSSELSPSNGVSTKLSPSNEVSSDLSAIQVRLPTNNKAAVFEVTPIQDRLSICKMGVFQDRQPTNNELLSPYLRNHTPVVSASHTPVIPRNHTTVRLHLDDLEGWTREISIDGTVYKEKYCYECNIFRPKNVSHCGECNACILDMDHHCLWFQNCVGRNNSRFFLIYLLSTTGALFYAVMGCEHFSRNKGFIGLLWAAVGVGYLLGLLVLGGFSLYHIYLRLCGVRSRDMLRGRATDRKIDIWRAIRWMSSDLIFIGIQRHVDLL